MKKPALFTSSIDKLRITIMKTQVVILLTFIVGISCSTKSNEEEITTDRSNWDHLTELEFPEAYPTAHATVYAVASTAR